KSLSLPNRIDMEDQGDRQRDRKSMMITGVVQLVLLAVLYVLVAWREPNPPIPEYGVELSFGVATGGNAAPPQEQPVAAPSPAEQAAEEPEEAATSAEPTTAEQDQPIEETTPGDLPIEDTSEPDAAEAESNQSEPVVAETPSETAQETTTEQVPAVQQPAVAVTEDLAAPASENSDEESVGSGNDRGDEVQGEPEAEIDQRALYGNVTGQEGASLQMSGWIWDFEPTPQDDSEESGRIVYTVTIDDEGYIIKIVPKTSTVSPSVEKYYRQAVERLTFSKTSSYKPAPTSTGTITFIIKTK
ncbi:MAG: hypothetical protein AAGA85_26650, partial [Bacteroidota bacterium]